MSEPIYECGPINSGLSDAEIYALIQAGILSPPEIFVVGDMPPQVGGDWVVDALP